MFWVYENWRAQSKAVVHTAECSRCRDGQGTGKGTLGEQNGRWHGPFDSRDTAQKVAAATGRRAQECSFCMRGQS